MSLDEILISNQLQDIFVEFLPFLDVIHSLRGVCKTFKSVCDRRIEFLQKDRDAKIEKVLRWTDLGAQQLTKLRGNPAVARERYKIAIFGGTHITANTCLNDVITYDLLSKRWTPVTENDSQGSVIGCPTCRCSSAAVLLDRGKRLLVMGGHEHRGLSFGAGLCDLDKRFWLPRAGPRWSASGQGPAFCRAGKKLLCLYSDGMCYLDLTTNAWHPLSIELPKIHRPFSFLFDDFGGKVLVGSLEGQGNLVIYSLDCETLQWSLFYEDSAERYAVQTSFVKLGHHLIGWGYDEDLLPRVMHTVRAINFAKPIVLNLRTKELHYPRIEGTIPSSRHGHVMCGVFDSAVLFGGGVVNRFGSRASENGHVFELTVG